MVNAPAKEVNDQLKTEDNWSREILNNTWND